MCNKRNPEPFAYSPRYQRIRFQCHTDVYSYSYRIFDISIYHERWMHNELSLVCNSTRRTLDVYNILFSGGLYQFILSKNFELID